ncbi:phytanoyl-CoA dioxygenase family protein [Pelagibacteraceae bacterium]|nr:phytanoyl-CoA dioxygenase family protein [Pelagibacteraceae bacterium]
MYTNSDILKLSNDGFLLKKNLINSQQIDKIKKIITSNPEGKGTLESVYSVTFNSFLIKLLKIDFKKIFNSLYFLKIQNQLKLNSIASDFFNHKSKLVQIDGYHNHKQETEILPWHCDQSYTGAKIVNKLSPPENFNIKFMIYLTNVGPNNGCTSYIPGSHKVVYALRSCLYKKKIEYKPYWSISDFVKLIKDKKNYSLIIDELKSKELFNDFLDKAETLILLNNSSKFDFEALAGDVLIFNELGFHKGSRPTKNDRVVLRYLFKKKATLKYI